jgi:hypothetical protein
MSVDVVYFDYWTRGVRHFAKVNIDVRARGLNSLLVHLGSQRGEPLTKNQIISGINCRDLALYSYDLIKMLRAERPKVVLLLNNQTEDKIIIRACRNLGIKTVFLMHGVLSPQDKVDEAARHVDSSFGATDRISRIPKYLRLLRQYLSAAVLKSFFGAFDSEIYMYFARQAVSPGGNLAGRWKYRDSRADIALVYSDEDKRLFCSCFGYRADEVAVVGNYNFDDLYAAHRRNLISASKGSSGKYVVYVENGFSDPKYPVPGWTEDRVADEVENLAGICSEYGYILILKLHPSSDYSTLIRRFSDHLNIKLVLHCDLGELVAGADVIVGQSSSVLMMAFAVRKPVVILDLPPLRLQLTTYADRKMGVVVKSFAEFRAFLREAQEKTLLCSGQSEVAHQFIGPFDGKSSSRISDILISFAS